jgi:tripartite-type tricarboxylate transporter receptor subunit TctC
MTARTTARTPTLVSRRATLLAAPALLAAPWATAQTFPERQLTIVVPAPPGGTADISSRAISDPLGKALGQAVAVDNKGGGNGAVGAQVVINAKPDGHTGLAPFPRTVRGS